MAIEVGGKKVDAIVVRIEEASEVPEYRTVLEPLYIIKSDDVRKVAKEIAWDVARILTEEFDAYESNMEEINDYRIIRKHIESVLKNPPIYPEQWTVLPPSEIAYITVIPYKVTKVIE